MKRLIVVKARAGYQVGLIHRSYFLSEFIIITELLGSFINTVRQDLEATRGSVRCNVILSRSNSTNPRFWKPLEVKTARVDAPSAAGTYGVYLNLPDPLLKGNVHYNLRFANENVWDSSKITSSQASAAFNALGQSIQIS